MDADSLYDLFVETCKSCVPKRTVTLGKKTCILLVR
jgi:hypothetical protein